MTDSIAVVSDQTFTPADLFSEATFDVEVGTDTGRTCHDCSNWFPVVSGPGVYGPAGQCRVAPPDVPTLEFRTAGRVYTYRLTLACLPACRSFSHPLPV